jgi:hypothetical protein
MDLSFAEHAPNARFADAHVPEQGVRHENHESAAIAAPAGELAAAAARTGMFKCNLQDDVLKYSCCQQSRNPVPCPPSRSSCSMRSMATMSILGAIGRAQ